MVNVNKFVDLRLFFIAGHWKMAGINPETSVKNASGSVILEMVENWQQPRDVIPLDEVIFEEVSWDGYGLWLDQRLYYPKVVNLTDMAMVHMVRLRVLII